MSESVQTHVLLVREYAIEDVS